MFVAILRQCSAYKSHNRSSTRNSVLGNPLLKVRVLCKLGVYPGFLLG